VTWRQIETRPGVYDFARLDAVVRTARSRHADVLLVLGQTPQFHAQTPGKLGVYGAGASSMPDLPAWKRYVAAVARRYARQKVTLQVWNEANVTAFWNGTPAQMAQLTKAAYDVLDRMSPRPTLVAPALVTRRPGQRAWLQRFYAQRVGGRPVADWVDVVSLQLYPLGDGEPEDSMKLLAQMRATLARSGVSKPIWNTEVNYGLVGGTDPVANLSPERQAANVARTYLLNAAAGVKRVYWYTWARMPFANTNVVEGDGVTTTAAGRAFRVVRSWMKGTRAQPCNKDAAGTYLCVLVHPTETRDVYWNPSHNVRVPVVGTRVEHLDGESRAVPRGRTRIQVGASPVLVRSPLPRAVQVPTAQP
jgi:hypothetical protein